MVIETNVETRSFCMPDHGKLNEGSAQAWMPRGYGLGSEQSVDFLSDRR